MVKQLTATPIGIGLRQPHFEVILNERPALHFLEVHSENYFSDGSQQLNILLKLRKDYPVSLHGVGLSIGSTDTLNAVHLQKLKQLIEKTEPLFVSEHLSWSSFNGQHYHDLFPLPFTKEALNHVVSRLQEVQDYLNRPLIIENISSYRSYPDSAMTEWDFLIQVAKKSGCGILLDVNNCYVNAMHFQFNPIDFIRAIPKELVHEIHLGGFQEVKHGQKKRLLDTHAAPVAPAVWALYRDTIQCLGPKPTLIEWDNDLPAFQTLLDEAFQADQIMRETNEFESVTS